MSRLYVYALAGSHLPAFTAAGRHVYSLELEGIHVVVDRRSTLVKPSEEALRCQHAVVEAVAARADAVLPARFGSLVELDDIRGIVAARSDAIRAALETVRGCVQMTLRTSLGRQVPTTAHRTVSSSGRAGTAYLEAKRAAVVHPDPAVLEAIRGAITGLARREHVQPGRGVVPPAVFHLVTKGQVTDYRSCIDEVAARMPGTPLRISGPWPAFAFTPELF
ncbi:hypothetical protein BH23ACI1_BH23ACI1_16140 [soil metagenome]|nr:GvpL/GvpF family gas vesicle protein [Acidobacteriota bacterium]